MKSQNIKYIHLRYELDQNEGNATFSNFGGATIAYKITEDPKDKTCTKIELGLSKCSMNENFCRRIGRTIATYRLLMKAPHWYFFMETEIPINKSSYDLVLHYALAAWPKELKDFKCFVNEKSFEDTWTDNHMIIPNK
jgi:hypothetical protein